MHAPNLARRANPRRLPEAYRQARVALTVGLFVVVATVGCGDSSTIVEADHGPLSWMYADVFALQGVSQEGEAGATLLEPLVVEARNPDGSAVPGVRVAWVFHQGAGTTVAGSGGPSDTLVVTTDAAGRASVLWQLDTVAASHLADARILWSADRGFEPSTTIGSEGPIRSVQFNARVRAGPVRRISISPDAPKISVNDSVGLAARALDKWGNAVQPQPTFSWTSSTQTVATVNGSGMTKGLAPGSSSIRATYGGVVGMETVTVAPGTVAGVTVAPSDARLVVGDTIRLVATAVDSAGAIMSGTQPVWGSSSPSVGAVDSQGLFRAVTAGSTWVWAKVGNVTGGQTVIVTAPTASVGIVTDLRVVSKTSTSVTLRWTQVTNGVGGVASYAIRKGSPTITWSSAAGSEVTVGGTQIGVPAEYTWTGLSSGTAHQFQLVAYRGILGTDAVLGSTSNVAAATTAPDPQQPPTTGKIVYFHSDWATSTGSATSTILDVGKQRPWTVLAFGSASQISVRSTATEGRDYPTRNFIRFNTLGGAGGSEINYRMTDGYVPEPMVGDSVGLRFYFRLVTDRVLDPNLQMHPTYFDAGGTSDYGWGPEAAGFTLQFDHNLSGNRFLMGVSASRVDPNSQGLSWVPWKNGYIGLTPHTTYRAELLYVRKGTNEWYVSGRVYDASGAMVIDEVDWRGTFWGQSGQRLIDFTRSRTTPSPAGAQSIRGLVTGFEGADNSGVDRPIIEYAGYAVCSTWCGAYPIFGVEN